MRIVLSERHLAEWPDCSRTLVKVLLDLVVAWPAFEMVLGDLHRTQAEEDAIRAKIKPHTTSGIHVEGPPYRACDVLTRGITQAMIGGACKRVNALWIYDPARPTKVVAYGDPHGTGPHVHLQVHPTTVRRADARTRA